MWQATTYDRLPKQLSLQQHHPVAAHSTQQQSRSKSIFVSRHNQTVGAPEIHDLVEHHQLGPVRSSSTHVLLQECPFCPKPTKGKADNQYKLYVQVGDGAYFCHRCGAGGSWYDLKQRLGNFGVTTMLGESHQRPSNSSSLHTPTLPLPAKRLQALYTTQLVDRPDNNPVLDYLHTERGLTTKTLRKYGVGRATYSFLDGNDTWTEADCVTFPWMLTQQQVQVQEDLRGAKYSLPEGTQPESFATRRIKARALDNKAWQRLDPPGGGWGLFGWHTVPADTTELVLTEGEYDAMAVWQATGRPAVSLPNGCRSLPVEVLPLLENFERIYLWMDNDGPGQEGAEKFAKKLGLNRCFLVRGENAKDANEALQKGLDLEQILSDAKSVPHEQILSFDELRDDVLNEILYPDQFAGVPMKSLPELTNLIKGFRRGELTVLTGPTGSGKTTFLGQLSLDLAQQDLNVLWGSFEIKNTRLLHKLLQQFAQEPLGPHKEQLENIADRFRELPLYFLKFHGGTDVEAVLDAMEYAVYVNDVEHIILDNLQFMISRQNMKSSTFDKFDVQDVAIEKFRQFATAHNVHISLVVHPRKEQEDSRLSLSSIYGSAKATQEADTVLILQNDGRSKYLEVKKNRFNGTLGKAALYFNPKTNAYTNEPQVSAGGKPVSAGGGAQRSPDVWQKQFGS